MKGEGGVRGRKGRIASARERGEGLTCPLSPGSPDWPCRGSKVKKRWDPGASPRLPISLPCPAHLLPFLTRETGHPRVTLKKENLVLNAVVATTVKGAGSAGVYRPDAPGTRCPRHPTPDCWAIGTHHSTSGPCLPWGTLEKEIGA